MIGLGGRDECCRCELCNDAEDDLVSIAWSNCVWHLDFLQWLKVIHMKRLSEQASELRKRTGEKSWKERRIGKEKRSKEDHE